MRVKLTEHALLRFCERVMGFDRERTTKVIADTVGPRKNGRFQLPGTQVCAKVVDGVVVTIEPVQYQSAIKRAVRPKKRPKHTRPQRLPSCLEQMLADDDYETEFERGNPS